MQFREITQQTQARTVSDLETTEGKGREGEKENWAGQQGTQGNSSPGIHWRRRKLAASLALRSTDGLLIEGT